jgi:hypothetical protein
MLMSKVTLPISPVGKASGRRRVEPEQHGDGDRVRRRGPLPRACRRRRGRARARRGRRGREPGPLQPAASATRTASGGVGRLSVRTSMPRRSSRGGVQVVACGASCDGRHSPAQLLERAFPGAKLGVPPLRSRSSSSSRKSASIRRISWTAFASLAGARLDGARIAGGDCHSSLGKRRWMGSRLRGEPGRLPHVFRRRGPAVRRPHPARARPPFPRGARDAGLGT